MISRLIPLLASTILIVGCGQNDKNESSDDPIKSLQSELIRETTIPDTSSLGMLRDGIGDFAFELYRELNTSATNLAFSPYSISAAFTMLYAGSANETKSQIHDCFHFLDNDTLHHQTYNSLDRSVFDGEENLTSANSLWLQKDFSVKQDFLDILTVNYGADLKTVDFAAEPEPSRLAINEWVSDHTNGLIPQTLQEGDITPLTRFVLVNAIHFLGQWKNTFSPEGTTQESFYLRDGNSVMVDMMHQMKYHAYYRSSNYSAISRPYNDYNHKMVIVLPDSDVFEDVENSLTREELVQIINLMTYKEVILSMPRFRVETDYKLHDHLQNLGVTDAFDEHADFSVLSDFPLAITEVIHKAVVKVDESGTEAAAVTAVIVGATSTGPSEEDPIIMSIDRPFFFFIMDSDNTILFMGKVENPNG